MVVYSFTHKTHCIVIHKKIGESYKQLDSVHFIYINIGWWLEPAENLGKISKQVGSSTWIVPNLPHFFIGKSPRQSICRYYTCKCMAYKHEYGTGRPGQTLSNWYHMAQTEANSLSLLAVVRWCLGHSSERRAVQAALFSSWSNCLQHQTRFLLE